jgi:hypothetical protein
LRKIETVDSSVSGFSYVIKGVRAMTCSHFEIAIRSRGKNAPAVAGAAYISASKLHSDYRNRYENYSYKQKELVHSEILLPDHAPPNYMDREKLWNSVDLFEKQWNAQLARRIVAALPVELPMDQCIEMVREYCQENFVSQGMCCDFAIHDPPPAGHNPHVHIMLTMRGIDEKGKWMPKGRKVYDLDGNGDRIRLPSGRWKSHKEDLTGWNRKENAEAWRHSWEEIQNRYLEQNGREERISLKSYARQGLDIQPMVHMGPAVAAMEKKGIETTIGNLNREIRQANHLITSIRKMLSTLAGWVLALHDAVKEAQEDGAARPEPVYLGDLILAKIQVREAERAAWGRKARAKGMVRDAEKIGGFTEVMRKHQIVTVNDLNDLLIRRTEETDRMRKSVRAKKRRVKQIAGIRNAVAAYRELKPLANQYAKIGWKSRKQKFRSDHFDELVRYQKVFRYLKINLPGGMESFDEERLLQEEVRLEQELQTENQQLRELQAELKQLREIRYFVKEYLPEFTDEEIGRNNKPRSIREQLEINKETIARQARPGGRKQLTKREELD